MGAVVASTTTVALVATGFFAALVAAAFVPWRLDWLSWLQTIASVTSLVLLFALHHTTHRDQIAVQRKLDELLRASPDADSGLARLETAPEEKLDEIDERHTQESTAS